MASRLCENTEQVSVLGKVRFMSRETDIVRDVLMYFGSDPLYSEINPSVSFADVWLLLMRGDGKGIYDLLGVNDSMVREAVFDKLAEIKGVNYDYIYELWLHGAPPTYSGKDFDAPVRDVLMASGDDPLYAEINGSVTFRDVYELLADRNNTRDVYDLLGVGDSMVREAVFSKLAEIVGCDYDDIYRMWL